MMDAPPVAWRRSGLHSITSSALSRQLIGHHVADTAPDLRSFRAVGSGAGKVAGGSVRLKRRRPPDWRYQFPRRYNSRVTLAIQPGTEVGPFPEIWNKASTIPASRKSRINRSRSALRDVQGRYDGWSPAAYNKQSLAPRSNVTAPCQTGRPLHPHPRPTRHKRT